MLHDCFNVCTSIVSSYRAVVCVLSRKDFQECVAPLMQKTIVQRMEMLRKAPLLRGIIRETGTDAGGRAHDRRESIIQGRRKSSVGYVEGRRSSSGGGGEAPAEKNRKRQRKRRNSLSLVFDIDQGPGNDFVHVQQQQRSDSRRLSISSRQPLLFTRS